MRLVVRVRIPSGDLRTVPGIASPAQRPGGAFLSTEVIMITSLLLAAAMAVTGQCQPGMACYRGGYSYGPQTTVPPSPYSYGPAPAPAPVPPAPAAARRPTPPSPAAAAQTLSVADLDRKIDA